MELAIYEDCKLLLQHFLKSDNLHFESFCESWLHNTFCHIWSAQTTYVELMQTTAALLHFAKRSACGLDYSGKQMPYRDDKQGHAFRIFGIYLMYAIFFKQPTKDFVKIEVSLTTWSTLRDYVDGLRETNNSREASETCYIFWQLVKSNAFRFTAHDFCLGLESLINYDDPPKKPNRSGATTSIKETHTSSNLSADLPQITKTAAMMPPLVSLEQKYNQMKREISRVDANAQSLPTTSTMAQELEKIFGKIERLLGEPTICEMDDGACDINTNESQTLGNRRRNLKLIATGVVSSKPNLKETNSTIVNIESNSDSDEHEEIDDADAKEVTSDDLLQRRTSAHTVFSKKLPISLSEELDSHNSDNNDFE